MAKRISSETWSMLHARSPNRGEYAVQPALTIDGVGELLMAMDSQGARHLLLPVATGYQAVEDSQSTGVQVRSHKLIDGGRQREFVDLVCLKPHLYGVFDTFIEDVMTGLEKEPAFGPDRVAIKVLDEWRELLESTPPGVLSRAAIVGLFAELMFLERLVGIESQAVERWAGPDRNRHDFTWDSIGLEVKATTRRDGRIFEISGARQLEPEGELYLAAVKLEFVLGGGRSIPDLVSAIERLATPRRTFSDKLAAIGYSRSAEADYESIRLQVVEERLYRVDGSFPRIVPSSFVGGQVPPGISQITYSVDLTGEPPMPISEAEGHRVLVTLAGAAGG